jgi:hypothetical protein
MFSLLCLFGLFHSADFDDGIINYLLLNSIYPLLVTRIFFDFMDIVWMIILSDLILQFITKVLKVLFVTLSIVYTMPENNLDKLLNLLQHFSQFYRKVVPHQLWTAYIINQLGGFTNNIYNFVFLALYLLTKYEYCYIKVKIVYKILMWTASSKSYGTEPNSLEVKMAIVCVICLRGKFFKPTKLINCDHVFCDKCISKWLAKNNTCPTCRVEIPVFI